MFSVDFPALPEGLTDGKTRWVGGGGGGAGSETLDTHSISEKLNSSVFLKDNLIVNCQ